MSTHGTPVRRCSSSRPSSQSSSAAVRSLLFSSVHVLAKEDEDQVTESLSDVRGWVHPWVHPKAKLPFGDKTSGRCPCSSGGPRTTWFILGRSERHMVSWLKWSLKSSPKP